ncbi:GDSL-type esterase/lipase family protein [Pontibacter sp. 13R65]|uniref:GDSL-type esterase/lipase family protein n=1 Tax=Pontibacter sp. 13R65 TaxID=3127458 RepID=UPI00301BAA2E
MRSYLIAKNILKCLVLVLLTLGCAPVAQNLTQGQVQDTDAKPPYWDTVQRFKREDADRTPPENAILFIGSSSFTNWHNAQQMFPEYTIVNRGFGGSQLPDINLYLREVGYPPKVKQIIIYSGDNDIASGKEPEEVLQRFISVFSQIRKDKPKLPVAFISIKVCPGRIHSRAKVEEANRLVKDFLAEQKRTEFVDIVTPTTNDSGTPLAGIYVEDGVHLNQKGYDIWAAALKPHLMK